jgi:hypothetical protein
LDDDFEADDDYEASDDGDDDSSTSSYARCLKGKAGSCIDINSETCDGASTINNFCDGASNVKCCPEPGNPSGNYKYTVSDGDKAVQAPGCTYIPVTIRVDVVKPGPDADILFRTYLY